MSSNDVLNQLIQTTTSLNDLESAAAPSLCSAELLASPAGLALLSWVSSCLSACASLSLAAVALRASSKCLVKPADGMHHVFR
jgi:hypothetical protein